MKHVIFVVLSVLLICLATFAVLGSFGGTWEGDDVGDQSLVSLVITQDGDQLTATFSDSFSTTEDGDVISPGYVGEGTGTTTSSTSARLTIHFTRSDGDAADADLRLTLSGSSLVVDVTRWDEYDISPPDTWARLQRTEDQEPEATQTTTEEAQEEDEEDEEEAPVGEELAFETFALGFFDPFNYFPHADWTWLREDRSRWSTTQSGSLRIELQQSGWVPSDMRNLLIQPAPDGTFTAETHLIFNPQENFQEAGMILYADDDNYYKVGRENAIWEGCTFCKGNAITFAQRAYGQLMPGTSHQEAETVDEIYLRIVVEQGMITSYYSEDGAEWKYLNSDVLMWEPVSIGLYTNSDNRPASGTAAEFDYFAMQEGVTEIAWFRVPVQVRRRGSGAGTVAVGLCQRYVETAFHWSTGDFVSTIDSGCLCGEEFDEWWVGAYWDWSAPLLCCNDFEHSSDKYCNGCYREIFAFIEDCTVNGHVIDTYAMGCACEKQGPVYDWDPTAYAAWANALKKIYPGGCFYLYTYDSCTP